MQRLAIALADVTTFVTASQVQAVCRLAACRVLDGLGFRNASDLGFRVDAGPSRVRLNIEVRYTVAKGGKPKDVRTG